MRVALVNQPWGHVEPPVTTGGSIPIILYELARRLARSAEVIFYTRGRFRTHEIEHQEIRYRYLPLAPDKTVMKLMRRLGRFPDCHRPMFAHPLCYAGYAIELAMDLRRRKCDVVHIINMSQFVPIIRRINPDIRIVLHMQCEWLNQLDHDWIDERIEQCDRVLGCSDFITRKAQSRFPEFAEKFRTLYNGVDTDQFNTTDSPSYNGKTHGNGGGHDGGATIVFVGRVTPEKGVHTLLRAFGRVAEQFSAARLDVVGPEEINPPELVVPFADDPRVESLLPLFANGRPYRALLDKLAAPWGDRVRFCGNVAHTDELVSRYQSADVCVIPSVWEEPFGIPAVEAMSTGTPVIATRGGAFPEIIVPERTGLLVERGDVAELTDAIVKLLSDDVLRRQMGQAARQRAVKMFSWDHIAEELLDDYRELCLGQSSHTGRSRSYTSIEYPIRLTRG